jgi:hypothetical protein
MIDNMVIGNRFLFGDLGVLAALAQFDSGVLKLSALRRTLLASRRIPTRMCLALSFYRLPKIDFSKPLKLLLGDRTRVAHRP